jgi:hypothetical protein
VKNRFVVPGILLAGIALLVAWIAKNTYWDETTIPMPLRNEAATNPFYAAQRFVENLGATSSWDRFQRDVPTNAVIVVSSWHWDLAAGRRSRMEKWVEGGGRLVIDSSLVGGEEAFESWSGITRRHPQRESDEDEEEDEGDETGAPEEESAERAEESPEQDEQASEEENEPARKPRPCRRLHESVREVGSRRGAPADLELCSSEDFSQLTTTRRIAWAMQDDIGNQVLRTKVGKGSVTVINGMPFRYRSFTDADHAELLVLAAQLRRGDEVHFLSEEDHASLLTLMWAFGSPVVLLSLALIGLALWRNSARFGPLAAAPESARRSLAEQIRGTGQFVMRFGGGKALHAAAVRALDEAAQRKVSGYRGLSTNERVEAVARLTGIEASTLAPAINHSGPRRSHELRQALALIETARRRILIGKN